MRWRLRLIVLELKCDVGRAQVGNCPRDIRTVMFADTCRVNVNLGVTNMDFLKEEFNLVVGTALASGMFFHAAPPCFVVICSRESRCPQVCQKGVR